MKKVKGTLDAQQAYHALKRNDYSWYIVEYDDGSFDLTHQSGLSSILECGADPAEWGIEQLHQCWDGQELGDCPF